MVLMIFALMTFAGMKDQLSYNRALWQAVRALQQKGVADRDIDGGWMVNGWLQYAHPEHAYRDAQENVQVPWVNGSNERPYKIANARSDGWEMLERFRYARWLGSSGYIYVLKTSHGPPR